MERDDRLVARVPAWAWELVEEEPPYPPGTEDVWEVAGSSSLDDEKVPYDPFDGLTYLRTSTVPTELRAGLHPRIKLKTLKGRLEEKWTLDAREIAPEGREGFWARKIEAIKLLDGQGHLDVKENPSFDESTKADLNDLLEALQRIADAARTQRMDRDAAARKAKGKPKARYRTPGWKRAIVDVFLDSDNNWEPRMEDDKLVWEAIKFAQELFRRAEKSPFAPIRTKNQDGNTVKKYICGLSDKDRGGPWPGRGQGIMADWFRLAQRWRREWEPTEKGDGTISHN